MSLNYAYGYHTWRFMPSGYIMRSNLCQTIFLKLFIKKTTAIKNLNLKSYEKNHLRQYKMRFYYFFVLKRHGHPIFSAFLPPKSGDLLFYFVFF